MLVVSFRLFSYLVGFPFGPFVVAVAFGVVFVTAPAAVAVTVVASAQPFLRFPVSIYSGSSYLLMMLLLLLPCHIRNVTMKQQTVTHIHMHRELGFEILSQCLVLI